MTTWLVCGSRSLTDSIRINKCLQDLAERVGFPDKLIHGAAPGVDTIAGRWATNQQIKVIAFPAEWNLHGKRAGPIRNIHMLDTLPTYVIAFPVGKSPGTRHTIREAHKRDLHVIEFDLN